MGIFFSPPPPLSSTLDYISIVLSASVVTTALWTLNWFWNQINGWAITTWDMSNRFASGIFRKEAKTITKGAFKSFFPRQPEVEIFSVKTRNFSFKEPLPTASHVYFRFYRLERMVSVASSGSLGPYTYAAANWGSHRIIVNVAWIEGWCLYRVHKPCQLSTGIQNKYTEQK